MTVRTYVILCRLIGWLGIIPHLPFSIHMFLRAHCGLCGNGFFNLSNFVGLGSSDSRFLFHPVNY